MSFVGRMPLLQAKKPNPTPPTGLGSTPLHQEILEHSKLELVDSYSDNGYPTLPRPKVILSLRHSDGGTWSRKQASLLQTVPVRILNKDLKRARSLSLDTATTSSLLQQTPTQKAVPHPENEKQSDSKHSSSKPRIGRSKSLCSHHSKLSKSSSSLPACKSPLLTDSREPSLTPPAQLSPTQDMSSNHSRILARKTATDASKASSGGSRKPKKISRAITFSFGGGSDKKRRTLGFLGKSKRATEDQYDVPSSPILTTRKNSQISGSASVHDLQRRAGTEEIDSGGHWGPVAVHPHHEGGGLLKNHFGSCRDFHSIEEEEELRHQPRVPLYIPVRTNTESPDISPTFSGLSSRQDSVESLSLSLRSEPTLRRSVSSPPSRSNSPNVWKSQENHMTTHSLQRKLSDPAQLDLELGSPQGSRSPVSNGSSPRGSNLKKRNTFCVRETKLTPKPGWVIKLITVVCLGV